MESFFVVDYFESGEHFFDRFVVSNLTINNSDVFYNLSVHYDDIRMISNNSSYIHPSHTEIKKHVAEDKFINYVNTFLISKHELLENSFHYNNAFNHHFGFLASLHKKFNNDNIIEPFFMVSVPSFDWILDINYTDLITDNFRFYRHFDDHDRSKFERLTVDSNSDCFEEYCTDSFLEKEIKNIYLGKTKCYYASPEAEKIKNILIKKENIPFFDFYKGPFKIELNFKSNQSEKQSNKQNNIHFKKI